MKNYKLTKKITSIDRIFQLRDENKRMAVMNYDFVKKEKTCMVRSAKFFVHWSAQMLFTQIKYGDLYEVEKIVDNENKNNE